MEGICIVRCCESESNFCIRNVTHPTWGVAEKNFTTPGVGCGQNGGGCRFLKKSAFGETEFSAAASFLAPSKDYGEVGNVASHTKFVVAPDGRVRCANGSVCVTVFPGTGCISIFGVAQIRRHLRFLCVC
jgi:hypothetical protein